MSQVNVSSSEETIRLTNGEWAPYFSENLEYYGVGSRIVTEAFALEGITVIYGFFPWSRGLKLAENGSWDGAVGWEINAEREQDLYASDDVWETPWVFFYMKKNTFDWKAFDDLKDVRIGATLGYMYTKEFLDAERSGKISVDRGATSDQQGFRKLMAGRFDIFPQLIDVGYYQLNASYDAQTVNLFTHHPTPFGKHKEQLLLSKKHERNIRLIKLFNKGLRQLKDSGKYDEYFNELRRDKPRH
ncbi:MAG: ABC transporter substrate-binding protein [Proteobacteria bacterium]|nr:ABC transporter substrate-binding protein [Pseudomonadota bacterium]